MSGDAGEEPPGDALLAACEAGRAAEASALLLRGAARSAALPDGRDALMLAAEGGHTALVRLLLDAGASPAARNAAGRCALMLACAAGHAGTASVLLDAGASPADVAFSLRVAAQHGRSAVVAMLLARGAAGTAGEDAEDGGDEATAVALNFAAQYGRTEAARLLLDAGANVEALDEIGGTALLYAAYKGHAGTSRLLARRGANVERLCPQMGETPVFLAVRGGHARTVEALLDEGASSDSDEHGSLVAHASALGQLPVVYHLVAERGLSAEGAEADAAVFPQVAAFLALWRAGAHPVQVERAVTVRALLGVRTGGAEVPADVAHLVGQYFHSGGRAHGVKPRVRPRTRPSSADSTDSAVAAGVALRAELAATCEGLPRKRVRLD